MIFGYTPFDPFVVVIGTMLAAWYLYRKPVRLMGFMPTALSLWFFIPFVTNLTLWQTVPMLLTGRMLLNRGMRMARSAQPTLVVLLLAFALSVAYALIGGSDSTRVAIRVAYYLGVFSLFAFAYEMGRRPDCYEILLKGLVAMGVVYSAYGLYQIVALFAGLPVRGIVYNDSGNSILAYEAGLARINSLTNEPKRLGYVLFLAAMACMFLARLRSVHVAQRLRWIGAGIFGVSLLTFSGSYFLALALFTLATTIAYPTRTAFYLLGGAAVGLMMGIIFPDLGIIEAIQHGYERRTAEVQIGLNSEHIYRQEFFAWDFLDRNPAAALTGLGVGQYYSVLHNVYGIGVGYDAEGGLMPLNSNFLELVFDLGGIATILLYGSLIILAVALRRGGNTFYCLALLFLIAQSVTLLNLLWIALFSGAGLGQLEINPRSRQILPRRRNRLVRNTGLKFAKRLPSRSQR